MKKGSVHTLVFCVVAAVGVVCDQATKVFMREVLSDGIRRVFIPHILDLYLVDNTGAAFSMGEGAGLFFVCVAIAVACGALAWVIWQPNMPWILVISLACVAGGGIGNLIDRVVYGAVCDFLATSFINFPVFNVADILITVGTFVAFASYMWWDGHEMDNGTCEDASGGDITDLDEMQSSENRSLGARDA